MTIKTSARAALVAALAASTIWGVAASSGAGDHHASMHMGKADHGLVRQLAKARLATAQYAFDLKKAKKAGYKQITPVMKNMGFHYLNPGITKFDVTKPPILVYTRRDGKYQLGALEWVFPTKPKKPPLKGATYGSFPAACHFDDGTFVTACSEADCKPKNESRIEVLLLAPGPRDAPRVALVPQPGRALREHEPLRAPFNGG